MTIRQSRAIRRALLTIFTPFLLLTGASAAAADAPLIREAFACQYINGADQDDLMKARDDLMKRMDKLGTKFQSFLWTPMVGTIDVDFLWFDVYDNIDAWAAVTAKFATSAEGTANQQQFEKIVKCNNSLSFSQQIYANGELGANPPVVIDASSCKLRHGQTMANVEDLVSHIRGALPQTGGHSNFAAYMGVPFESQTDAEVRFFGVYNTPADFAAGVNAFQNSEAGVLLGRHFNQVVDCKGSLWWGERIIGE